MAGDWLKLHRSMQTSLAMSDDWLCRLWISCLLKANWKTGFFKGEQIDPGQFAFSYRVWCESLNVSKGKLQRGLRKLEQECQISIKAGRQFTVITVANWADFQGGHTDDGTQTGHGRDANETQTGHEQAIKPDANETQIDTQTGHDRRRKEGKKERREDTQAFDFSNPEVFWGTAPIGWVDLDWQACHTEFIRRWNLLGEAVIASRLKAMPANLCQAFEDRWTSAEWRNLCREAFDQVQSQGAFPSEIRLSMKKWLTEESLVNDVLGGTYDFKKYKPKEKPRTGIYLDEYDTDTGNGTDELVTCTDSGSDHSSGLGKLPEHPDGLYADF